LAKGFKDSRGKFHPTGNNGTSSRKKSIETSGIDARSTRRMIDQQNNKDHLELLKSGRIEGVHDAQREQMIKDLEIQLEGGIELVTHQDVRDEVIRVLRDARDMNESPTGTEITEEIEDKGFRFNPETRLSVRRVLLQLEEQGEGSFDDRSFTLNEGFV